MHLNLLDNWKKLNTELLELTEKQLEELLTAELEGKRRLTFVMRIYGRFSTVRTERERKDLLVNLAHGGGTHG